MQPDEPGTKPLTDGRDIDPRIGTLTGEASHQQSHFPEPRTRRVSEVTAVVPAADFEDPTYYGRPMLKGPVWKPYISVYYFVGGTAGASLALGGAAQLAQSRELDGLIRRCHWIGILGSSLGAMLLIADLGRPERFLYMMRVFRPTSPMNMGAWILTGAPTAAITAGILTRRSSGVLYGLGEAAGVSAGVFGLALATYTGVLLANTAIPVWQASRRILPILFGASGVAAAGSLLNLFELPPRARRIVYVFGLAGRLLELASAGAMEHRATRVPTVGRPLRRGSSGFLWRAANVLTACSIVALVWPGERRSTRVIAGVLGMSGSLALRFAVAKAGEASAADPRASFHQQRAGKGAAELRPQRKNAGSLQIAGS